MHWLKRGRKCQTTLYVCFMNKMNAAELLQVLEKTLTPGKLSSKCKPVNCNSVSFKFI